MSDRPLRPRRPGPQTGGLESERGNARRPLRAGWQPYYRDCLVVSLATGLIGVTFGVFADAAGFDLPRIVVMSALVFTGASQFAAAGVVSDGGSGSAAVGSALLLAARNALYGPVVRPVLPRSAPARLAASHFVIDETTALAAAQHDPRDSARAFWLTAVALWLFWNLGSAVGAMLGASLGSPEAWGLDAAFPAAFIALLAPHLRTAPGAAAALCAAAIAAATAPLTPSGLPLLLAAFAVGPGLLVRRFLRSRGGEQQKESISEPVSDGWRRLLRRLGGERW